MKPFVPPLQTRDRDPVGGHIGTAAEDFFVEEIPAYEPSGSGDHLYVFIEKRGKNTRDVAKELSLRLKLQARDIGFAGMKDKHAVTRQWYSLPPGTPQDGLEALTAEGFSVLQVSRHKNKLRTGHLIGNRFRIVLRDVPEGGLDRAEAIAQQLAQDGLDNYFGPQRFGRDGRNLDAALSWLAESSENTEDHRAGKKRGRGKQRGPDPKLLSSVIQSEIFNRYTARRLQTPAQLLEGEVVRLRGTGSHFIIEDLEREQPRFASGDLELTGPMIGPKGLHAIGTAKALEEEVTRQLITEAEWMVRLGRAAPGTRRDLKLRPEQLQVEAVDDTSLAVSFRLPAGAFATQVVRELTHADWDSPRTSPD